MDLPLSIPFLKLLACYGSSRGVEVDAEDKDSLEAGLTVVENTEAKRERLINMHLDPLFMGRRKGKVGGGGTHWLTGILDINDFAAVQPWRGKLFGKLLRVYAERKNVREDLVARGEDCPRGFLDLTGLEFLGCRVTDLRLDMEYRSEPTVGIRVSLTISFSLATGRSSETVGRVPLGIPG